MNLFTTADHDFRFHAIIISSRISSQVECLTAEREIASSIPRAGAILRDLNPGVGTPTGRAFAPFWSTENGYRICSFWSGFEGATGVYERIYCFVQRVRKREKYANSKWIRIFFLLALDLGIPFKTFPFHLQPEKKSLVSIY